MAQPFMLGLSFMPFSEKELLAQPQKYKTLQKSTFSNIVSHFKIWLQKLYAIRKIILLSEKRVFNFIQLPIENKKVLHICYFFLALHWKTRKNSLKFLLWMWKIGSISVDCRCLDLSLVLRFALINSFFLLYQVSLCKICYFSAGFNVNDW